MSCAGTFSYIFFFRERVSRMKGGFMNQKQKTMLKRIVAAAIVYIAAAAAKKMKVFAGLPQPWTELVVFLIP